VQSRQLLHYEFYEQRICFVLPAGAERFIFAAASRLVQEGSLTPPSPKPMCTGRCSPGIKLARREFQHSSPSGEEV
jgi:hypothetical protein